MTYEDHTKMYDFCMIFIRHTKLMIFIQKNKIVPYVKFTAKKKFAKKVDKQIHSNLEP